jgi:hypothetical protein
MKFVGHSKDHETYLWAKFQFKILQFNFSTYALPEVENPVKRSQLEKDSVSGRILLGFVQFHRLLETGVDPIQSSASQLRTSHRKSKDINT